MKILLLDDDEFLLGMYATKFAEGGNEVVTVKSVDEALEHLRAKEPYDAVVLDIVLPGATGIDFLKAIAKERLAAGAKRIVLSNQNNDEDMAAAKAAGADGYIIKANLIPSEVFAEIQKIVGAPAAAPPLAA